MTDPTNHPQGAEEIIKEAGKIHLVLEGYRLKDRVVELMHTHTEDWLKYFAERVKMEPDLCYTYAEDGHRVPAHIDEVTLDSLLSEVLKKMK